MNINSRTSKINFTGFASGAIASFTGLRETPAKVKVNTTGVSECNVVRCGVNVWDEEWEVGGYSTTTGEKTTATNRIRCKNPIIVKRGVNYYFHSNGATIRYFTYSEDGTFTGTYTTSDSVISFQSAYYITFQVETSYGTTYNNDISINYPSTDTDYHAYNGNTYTIPANEFTQIDQIIGENNIFADTGNVEVYYVTV